MIAILLYNSFQEGIKIDGVIFHEEHPFYDVHGVR